LLAAKEAGAGALLAELVRRYRPNPESVFLVEAAAAAVVGDLPVRVIPVAGADADIALSLPSETDHDSVVVGASAGPSIEKIVLRLAVRNGLPTTSVVDHYWNPWQRFADEVTVERWAYRPDCILVPHAQVAERLRALGCPVKVEVFQHPLLAPVHHSAEPSISAQARHALGIAADALVILLISEYGFEDSDLWQWDQPPDADLFGLASELFRFAADWRGSRPVHIVIRPHPTESRDWNSLVPSDIAGKVTIGAKAPKDLLFRAATFAIGLNSMLLAEAAAFEVPAYACYQSGRYEGPKLTDFRPEIRLLPAGTGFLPALDALVRAALVRPDPDGTAAP
jgi:hypothetical protein